MVEIADINDRESLQVWLEETNQPREACIALAHRAAMRVMPKISALSAQYRHSALPVLRALLVSFVVAKLLDSTDSDRETLLELKSAAKNAGAAAAYSAAADPVFTPYYLAADAVLVASGEPIRYGNDTDIDWSSVQKDCDKILDGTELFESAIESSSTTRAKEFFPRLTGLPAYWHFWIGWYERALAGEPQPWPLLLEIATQEDKFWHGSDADVMARINEIVERYEAAGAEVEPEALSDPRTAAVDPEAVRQLQARIAAVHPALTFNAHAVLEQIAQFRERVRSDNQLGAEHPEFRDGLVDFLNRLAASFAALLDRLPEPTEEVSEEAARDALTWRGRFTAGLAIELDTYTSPEALAKTVVPAGLIFSLGSVGALLGGPIGFFAGSYLGKLLVGEVKAGAAADRLEKAMTPDEDGSGP